jgi:predicted acyl esterase
MKKLYAVAFSFLMFGYSTTHSQAINGKLDDIKEFTTRLTVPFVMPDGIKLMTDVYVPRVRDSLVLPIDLGIGGVPPANITFIPINSQIIFYDSLNGQPNPNPYQLPSIFTRTPYNKGDFDQVGAILAIMGYNYMLQDMRGRYSSEGVYFPMYSDSWNKNAYHVSGHVLDYLPPSDPKFSNRHEDGYHSVKIIETIEVPGLYDGLPHTNERFNNGSIGTFGASALGNTQLQQALAHRVPDSLPALKCLMPVVATTEHYISTGYNNGVFRDRIVTGWLKGQIFSGTDDDLIPQDFDRQNSVHSSKDYDLPKEIQVNGVTRSYQQNKFEAANLCIDHFTQMRYPRINGNMSPAGFYPNSVGRGDMDGSAAPVNEFGETVDPVTQQPLPNLNYSRYSNLDVPVFHLTGWWDIFTEGQINTLNYTRDAISGRNDRMQKMVIGPWAHQTVASRQSGDRFYPKNVTDITRIDLSDFNINDVPLNDVVQSDLITWFRYNLNYQPGHYIGEPKFIIKQSNVWQNFADLGALGNVKVRVPSEDYVVKFVDMINFLSGNGTLSGLKIQYQSSVLGTGNTTIDVPRSSEPILPAFGNSPLTDIPFKDFYNDVPAYRFYIAGPDSIADALAGYPDNSSTGNYWMGTEVFPPSDHIDWKKMYFHQNGSLNESAPSQDEGYKTYISDPDDPILTVGGNNMIVRSPDGTRNSQSQMEMTDPTNAPYTMDREGVIQFNSDPIQDSLTIIGLPVVKMYAKSNPGGISSGPTDTDWFVRLCDVWPDGRVYFVQEGCVGARGREWARALVDDMTVPGASTYVNGVEDPDDKNIPFSNIQIGEIYEYLFKFQPIAYSFAKGHKLRILVSSTNYTRYQPNPNLPITDGEFFRRKPGDGQTYNFEGTAMLARPAVQRIHFSPDNPTSISLPVYNKDFVYTDAKPITVEPTLDITVFPNPSSDMIQVFANMPGDHEITITDITGRAVTTGRFDDNIIFNVEKFGKGIYFATVTTTGKSKEKITKKFIVQ